MKTIFVVIMCMMLSARADFVLTAGNNTSSNLNVGGLWINAGETGVFKVPENFGPFVVNFGGTNLQFDLSSDKTVVFGEGRLLVRDHWSLLQYFWLGLTTAGTMSLSGWGLKFLRKLTNQSTEL